MSSVQLCVSLLLQVFLFLVRFIFKVVFSGLFMFFFLAVALIVLVLVFVIMMVFSGFLVDLASVFSFLRWIKWVSAFRYASNVLYINEFRDLRFCLTNDTNICPGSGNHILDERGIDHASNWDLWKYFLALTLMAAISFLIAYVKLLFIKKMK
jgi:ATP-binding cassette subfamily G (WHITE) protein 2